MNKVNLKKYPNTLEKFRKYYNGQVEAIQQQLGGNEKLQLPSNDELEKIANMLGSALFYFLDENDINISIMYTKNSGFTYDIIEGIDNVISEKFNKRLDCEYTAIEEAFKILNDK